jgi:hypothetical protein
MRLALPWLAACSGTVPIDGSQPDPCELSTCVSDPPGAGARIGWADVAVGDDGVAWVSWAETDGPIVSGFFVARSDAPGAPLGEPIRIPVAEPPFVGTTEKPALAVTEGRIAVAYTGFGPQRHGDAHGAYVQLGTVTGDGDVTFEPAVLFDSLGDPNQVLEHARVAFDLAGEAWVLWKRQVYGVSDLSLWARESEAWAPIEVSSALSTSHDCSPPDFQFGPSARALLAVRNNVGGFLETLFVAGEEGVASEVQQVSDDTWRYNAGICPEHGPRVAEGDDGLVVAAWIAPVEDATVALRSTFSTDGGLTFAPPALDHESFGAAESWVALAVAAGGRTLTVVETTDGQSRLLDRASPDAAPVITVLETPDGHTDLESAEIASGGGRTVIVAQSESGLYLFDR